MRASVPRHRALAPSLAPSPPAFLGPLGRARASHPLVRTSLCLPTRLSLALLARSADIPASSPVLSTSARHVSYPYTTAPPIALARTHSPTFTTPTSAISPRTPALL
ncbi:hypothetical protein FS749_003993 [Ceratobasidium sp. UAMH 11750]|nr:hypothetical protein FS749_003993 [Ceratobasidium sp. UAMH 11750]